MENNSSKTLPFLCLLIAAFLMSMLLHGRGCNRPSPGAKQAPPAPQQYTDVNGKRHAQTPLVTASNDQIGQINTYYQHIIDSMAGALQVKDKRIKDLVKLNLSTQGTFRPIYIVHKNSDSNKANSSQTNPDSAKTISLGTGTKLHLNDSAGTILSAKDVEVRYNDPWLNITGRLDSDSSWRYTINEDLTITTYEKKTGLFTKQLFLDVASKNPNSIVTGLAGIRITPKLKKWGIGIQAGYYYNGSSFAPAVGVGIIRTIIRF